MPFKEKKQEENVVIPQSVIDARQALYDDLYARSRSVIRGLPTSESAGVSAALWTMKHGLRTSPTWDNDYRTACSAMYDLEHPPPTGYGERFKQSYKQWSDAKERALADLPITYSPSSSRSHRSSVPVRTASVSQQDTVRFSNDPVSCMRTAATLEVIMRAIPPNQEAMRLHDNLISAATSNNSAAMEAAHAPAVTFTQSSAGVFWSTGAERIGVELDFMIQFPPEGVSKAQIKAMRRRLDGFVESGNMDGFLDYYAVTIRPVIRTGLATSTAQAASRFSSNELGTQLNALRGAQPYAVTTLATGEYWNVLASATLQSQKPR
jgi:hypothetical protein